LLTNQEMYQEQKWLEEGNKFIFIFLNLFINDYLRVYLIYFSSYREIL
jgi:hypothetical protein